MQLEGKTAVVTGAAAGIGQALAKKFAAEGMKLVLADRDAKALEQTAAELRADGVDVLDLIVDVTAPAEVQALAAAAYERFGTVELLCNNAGVLGRILPIWEQPIENWEWVFDVNVKGVVNGLRAFVGRMIEQDSDAYVLNTGSIAGLITGPFFAPYNASKHAVVAISECLHHELRAVGSKVKVGVLCPGWVNTGLASLEAKLPDELQAVNASVTPAAAVRDRDLSVRRMVADSIGPDEIAEIVAQAVREERFYIFPHPERKADIEWRIEDLLAERLPAFGPRPAG
jgi:NAD(P)-dependent dehydrogenase (short-subunit alcohol dehydrogenase family)